MNGENKQKVIVGMSGGVDSSVAAFLLKEKGYEVIGVTMRTWENACEKMTDDENQAVNDAARVAEKLGIPHYVVDFRKEFEDRVIKYFVSEYKSGRTPNPCIVCNRYVKWEALLKYAESLGANLIATGHYALIDKYPKTGRYTVRNAVTAEKDQTYALCRLTQRQLKSTLMPVGEYTKDQVRKIAEEIDMEISSKPDSQDICFIPDGNYASFIKEYDGTEFKPGDFVDMDGHIIGKHKGIINYTVGQRKGLGISAGKHVYVHHIDRENNRVVICGNDELFSREVKADNINFMAIDGISGELRAEAKIRYAHKKAPCSVRMENGIIKCVFDEPQRAATSGQSLVVYDGEYVLCGGTII